MVIISEGRMNTISECLGNIVSRHSTGLWRKLYQRKKNQLGKQSSVRDIAQFMGRNQRTRFITYGRLYYVPDTRDGYSRI